MENFAVTDDIRAVVKEIYNTDMEAVRQLAVMATKLNAGGLEIPGNLIVTGTIKSTGDISSANYSLSGLNNSITATNTNLTATNTALATANTNLTTTLKDYVKYEDNMRITNRGTGNHEGRVKYIGLCGTAGECRDYIDVVMMNNLVPTKFKIEKA